MKELEVAVIVEVRNNHMFKIIDVDYTNYTKTTAVPLTSSNVSKYDYETTIINGVKCFHKLTSAPLMYRNIGGNLVSPLSDDLSENTIINGVICIHNYDDGNDTFDIVTSYIDGKLTVSGSKDLTNNDCDNEIIVTADPITESDKTDNMIVSLTSDGIYKLLFTYNDKGLSINVVKNRM